jgi:hypothetical protein
VKKARQARTKGAAAKVNPSQCSRDARKPEIANEQPSKHTIKGKTNKRNVGTVETSNPASSFHAIGRFQRLRSGRAARTANVLMDPGAELNLIRTDVLKGFTKESSLKVLETRSNPTDLLTTALKLGTWTLNISYHSHLTHWMESQLSRTTNGFTSGLAWMKTRY